VSGAASKPFASSEPDDSSRNFFGGDSSSEREKYKFEMNARKNHTGYIIYLFLERRIDLIA
jgi:hypothetical protein